MSSLASLSVCAAIQSMRDFFFFFRFNFAPKADLWRVYILWWTLYDYVILITMRRTHSMKSESMNFLSSSEHNQRLSKLKLTCFSSFKIDCWLIFVDTPPQPTPFDFWWLFAVRYSISDFTNFSNWSSVFQSSSAWLLLTDDVRLRCRPALFDFLRLPVFDATATGCDGGVGSLQLLSPVSFTSIALSLPFAWLVLSSSSRISFWARGKREAAAMCNWSGKSCKERK